MNTAYVAVALVAIVSNATSGLLPLAGREAIMRIYVPAMEAVGVPPSWIVFPISTVKLAGAAGLLAGLLGVPLVGTAGAVGLVLFWVCAAYTHVLANDRSPQFFLVSLYFLPLAVATVTLDLLS